MALCKKSYRWTFGLPLDFRFLPPQVQPFSHFVFLFVLFYQSFARFLGLRARIIISSWLTIVNTSMGEKLTKLGFLIYMNII